jgi:hypothetical protein
MLATIQFRLFCLPFSCQKSFKLREDHRLRVFENRELRRIFGPKGEEGAAGGWRRLHNLLLLLLLLEENNDRERK